MNNYLHLFRFVLLAVAAFQFSATASPPNIVVILADDFGYGSSNCYGADIQHIRTPNLNQLAREGMRFTDASTPAAVCTPTRYAFLTGRYAWRGPLLYGVLSPPEGPLMIEPELLTLPEYLKQRGYQTAHVGKWHLGYTNLKNVEDLSAQPLEPGPRSLGFDYHFAVPNQIDWLPKVYVENESIVGLRTKGKNPYGRSFYKGQPYHGYDAPQRVAKDVTQDLSDAAARWIRTTLREHPEEPFFLYFAPVAVHHPITPSDRFRGTSTIGPYGDFIHDLDHSVGEIYDALAYAGVLDETILIFTSDNGGDFSAEEQQGRDRGFKVNGDLRGDKHMIWEGGLRVPFIVRWPKMIPAGSVTDQMVNVTDIYATVQELLDGELMDPREAAPDSFSFYNLFEGRESAPTVRKTMVTNDVRGIVAIRMGDWKYIENDPHRPKEKAQKRKTPNKFQPELYNIKNDLAEAHNVIQNNAELAEKMQAMLDEIRSLGAERLFAK